MNVKKTILFSFYILYVSVHWFVHMSAVAPDGREGVTFSEA